MGLLFSNEGREWMPMSVSKFTIGKQIFKVKCLVVGKGEVGGPVN